MNISHEQALRLAAHQRLLLEKAHRHEPNAEVGALLAASPSALDLLDMAQRVAVAGAAEEEAKDV